MSYHSELHYQIANTNPRDVWGGFSETEEGFEPSDIEAPTDDDLETLEAELRTIDIMAWNEKAWALAESIRCALSDLRLATIGLDAPF